jgi:DNA-directed RNA polymerase specialized sigma24 family protein
MAGSSDALVQTLAAYYPQVMRLSLALRGHEHAARAVAQSVMRDYLSLTGRNNVDADQDLTRWFVHHTIITARQPQTHSPDLTRDPLMRGNQAISQWYPAFVTAVRALSGQQREAIFLRFGEELDLRGIATAMDCSTTAAQMHLDASLGALREYTGPLLESLVAELATQYQGMGPPDTMLFPAARKALRRYRWPRILRHTAVLLLALAVIALVIWAQPRIWPAVQQFLRHR